MFRKTDYQKRFVSGQRAKQFRIIKGAKATSAKTNISKRPTRIRMTRNVESHFVDVGQNSPACDTTGTVTLINTIPQGTTVNQRVGKKCLLQSVWVQGFSQSRSRAFSVVLEIIVIG